MTTRTRTRRRGIAASVAAATLAAATAAVTVLSGSASAGTSPSFLLLRHLPPHPSSAWYGAKAVSGLPEHPPFCYGEELPGGSNTRYREFWTELDTNARQFIIVTRNVEAAKDLTARLNQAIRQCAADTESQYPDINASYKDYGKLSVEEGARVHGVHTAADWGPTDINLFGVGRDGRTVTVFRWGQMGDFGDAPVSAFKKTTTTAVNRLY